MPWNDVRKQVLTVEFQSDMAAFSYCNLNYWFYSCVNMTDVTGWSHLAGVHEMKYTFSSCALSREAARKCPWGARRW